MATNCATRRVFNRYDYHQKQTNKIEYVLTIKTCNAFEWSGGGGWGADARGSDL